MRVYDRLRFAKFLETIPAEQFKTQTLTNGADKEVVIRNVRLNTQMGQDFCGLFDHGIRRQTPKEFLDEKIGCDPLNALQRNKLVEQLEKAYRGDPETALAIDNGSYTFKDLAEAVSENTEIGQYFVKMQLDAWEESNKDVRDISRATFIEYVAKNVKADPALPERQADLLARALMRGTMTQFNPNLADLGDTKAKIFEIAKMIQDGKPGAAAAVAKILELWDGEEPLQHILLDETKAFALAFGNDFLKNVASNAEAVQDPRQDIEITPQQRLKYANSFREIENPDEILIVGGDGSFSGNMIADEIEKDSDVGKRHIRMAYNFQVNRYERDFGEFLDEGIKAQIIRPEQKEKLANYFNKLAPGDSKPTLLMCEHSLSGDEAALEIRADSVIGKELVNMAIDDWWFNQEENENPQTFGQYLDEWANDGLA